ncbi:hypothetical protein BC826DRAFT_1183607 [Russula brevipes]|nr:hypothetical protein BC826DRAFT_1183607 [Russula brevipes]
MNAFWTFIASYLPSIRIYNDLESNYLSDDEESDDGSNQLPTTRFNSMTLPSPSKLGQRHDRLSLRTTSLDHNGTAEAGQVRVKQLETFNNRLQEQVLSLQRQLEHMQTDFSSTKMELEHQRSANTLLVSQKGQLSVELAQACAARQAQALEVHKLRTSYAELANSVRTLESSGEELRCLKTFLTKTDDYSGQQIVQALHDLNSEILQLAAAVSDEFPLTRRSPGLWKESHCEFVRQAIGDGMLALLRDGDHEDDPTVVQLAVQAWEVWCCRQVLDAFCAGAPPEVDRFLSDVFREMQSSEPQATTSRWRTLTHILSRLANFIHPHLTYFPPPYPTPGSTANNTPDSRLFALPMPRSRTPSNASASSVGDPSSRTGAHISGILAILSLPGAPTSEECIMSHARTLRRSYLPYHRANGGAARVLREGVSSAWFEVVVERPSVTPRARSKASARDVWPGSQAFDPATMENIGEKRGEAGRDRQPSYLDKKGEAEASRSKADMLESTLLVKPKVLLESVKELL